MMLNNYDGRSLRNIYKRSPEGGFRDDGEISGRGRGTSEKSTSRNETLAKFQSNCKSKELL